MMSRLALTPSIMVPPQCFCFLLELLLLLWEVDRMDSPSSNADYLHLEEMGAEAKVDADRDTGIGADVSVEVVVKGKGMSTCHSSSSNLSSFSFPFPFTIFINEAAPRDCCEAQKACVPFTPLGMISALRS